MASSQKEKNIISKRGVAATVYLAAFAICIICTCLLWRQPLLLAVMLALIAFVLLRITPSTVVRLYFVTAAIFGTLAEIIAVAAGAWSYSRPLFYVPIWLPVAWGVAALCIRGLSVALSPAPTDMTGGDLG